MNKVKVSIVSYLNSKPFHYGLDNHSIKHSIDLSNDIPSRCSQKLLNNEVDLGLIPVAVLNQMEKYFIVSDYCIGSYGKVDSVMLYSNVPLDKIKNILLDYQSKTSVILAQVLAKYFWKINPLWVDTKADYENTINDETAALIIGDRTFDLGNSYPYSYDLSEEWKKFTGLPFVFACWVANKNLPANFIEQFNIALKSGLDNRPNLITELEISKQYSTNIAEYLQERISYELDDRKKMGLELFMKYQSMLEMEVKKINL